MVKEKRPIFLKSRSFLYSDPVVIGYLSITKRYRPLRMIVRVNVVLHRSDVDSH